MKVLIRNLFLRPGRHERIRMVGYIVLKCDVMDRTLETSYLSFVLVENVCLQQEFSTGK